MGWILGNGKKGARKRACFGSDVQTEAGHGSCRGRYRHQPRAMTGNAARIDVAPPRRSAGPLWLVWGATLGLEALLYWIAYRSPALDSLVTPLYALALVPATIVTWRRRRPRQSPSRRDGERRQLFRRARKPGRA